MSDPIRIIAWGNRGRCDDGVGLALAERLEERFAGDADIRVQQYHQLGPELADDLGRCRLAIFIDAHVRPHGADVVIESVTPAQDAGLHTHHCPPPVLLALTASMGLPVPEAYAVLVRGRCFEFGDSLSPGAAAGLERAEDLIVDLIASCRKCQEVETMHELPIAMEIVRQTLEVARQHGAERIEEVEVQLGVLRLIQPEALRMSFEAASGGTPAQGASLRIIEEKALGVCRSCDCLYPPELDNFICPRCGQADARIVAGNDIILKSVVCRAAEEAGVS